MRAAGGGYRGPRTVAGRAAVISAGYALAGPALGDGEVVADAAVEVVLRDPAAGGAEEAAGVGVVEEVDHAGGSADEVDRHEVARAGVVPCTRAPAPPSVPAG